MSPGEAAAPQGGRGGEPTRARPDGEPCSVRMLAAALRMPGSPSFDDCVQRAEELAGERTPALRALHHEIEATAMEVGVPQGATPIETVHAMGSRCEALAERVRVLERESAETARPCADRPADGDAVLIEGDPAPARIESAGFRTWGAVLADGRVLIDDPGGHTHLRVPEIGGVLSGRLTRVGGSWALASSQVRSGTGPPVLSKGPIGARGAPDAETGSPETSSPYEATVRELRDVSGHARSLLAAALGVDDSGLVTLAEWAARRLRVYKDALYAVRVALDAAGVSQQGTLAERVERLAAAAGRAP